MANEQKPGILRNLRIKRVALVDLGANLDQATGDGAHIMLYKRHVEKEGGPSLGSVHVPSTTRDEDAEAEARRKKTEADNKEKPVAKKTFKDVVGLIAKALGATDATEKDRLIKEAEAAAGTMSTAPEGADSVDPAHIEAMKAQHSGLKKAIDMFGAGPHPPTHPVHSMQDAYAKMTNCLKAAGVPTDEPGIAAAMPGATGMTKAEQDRMTAIEAENTVLKSAVANITKANERAEVVMMLKSFKATPLKLEGEDNDVEKFLALKRANPAAYDRTMSLFKTADDQMAVSKAFNKVGSDQTGEGSAWAKIEAMAAARVEKSTTGLTMEQAIEKVSEENPKLVAQYRAEQQ